MVSSPTSVGDVLSLIGQAPVLHGSQTAIEKLRAAKSTFPMFGGGSGMMEMIQSLVANPTSLFQNPMSALSGQLGGMLTSLTGGMGAGGMLSALTGLQTSLSGLMAKSNSMLTTSGMLDIAVHSNLVSNVSVPDSMSLENLLGPLAPETQTFLGDIIDALPGNVQRGEVADVLAYKTAMDLIVSNSAAATVQSQAYNLAAASVACMFNFLRDENSYVRDVMMDTFIPSAVDNILAHHEVVDAMFSAAKEAGTPTENSDGGLAV